MPSVVVNPKSVRAFTSEAAFEAWLKQHHDRAEEIWIKIFKKASGKASIDASQAIDVALCWGWIDGIKKPLDSEAYLQRFTPRRGKSRWSQINVERVARLSKAGRMTPHGQLHVDAAKSDGRWAAAYPSPKAIEAPPELVAALAKNPRARRTYELLSKQYTFSIAYRLFHLKKPESRAKLLADVLARLSEGELPFAKPLRPTDKKPDLAAATRAPRNPSAAGSGGAARARTKARQR
jgi:uncharacterized protein YdeI (YjbR/CyaY-like superfamily)